MVCEFLGAGSPFASYFYWVLGLPSHLPLLSELQFHRCPAVSQAAMHSREGHLQCEWEAQGESLGPLLPTPLPGAQTPPQDSPLPGFSNEQSTWITEGTD